MNFMLSLYIQRAVSLLQTNAPTGGGGYYGAFSGGKDSVVIKELARMAGVRVDWHYSLTTLDPPELVRFVRDHHPDVAWDRPKQHLLARAASKGIPSRACRWCCAEYKESRTPSGSPLIIGVRVAESPRRARQWSMCAVPHRRTGSIVVLPIRLWSDDDVWRFIRFYKLPYCGLYDEGWPRLGCIGCPMQGARTRKLQFARWPGFERLWKTAFRRLWERRAGTQDSADREWFGSRNFGSWEEWFEWWMDGQKNITEWKIKNGLLVAPPDLEQPTLWTPDGEAAVDVGGGAEEEEGLFT